MAMVFPVFPEAYDFLQKEFSQAYRVFDRNNNDQLCCREVQLGFRRLGQ